MITVAGYNASLHPEGLRWTQPRHSIPSPSRRYRWAALMNTFRSGEGTPHSRDVSHRATSLPPRLPILLLPAAVGSPIWLNQLSGSALSDCMACIASYANDTFMKTRCVGKGNSGSLRRHSLRRHVEECSLIRRNAHPSVGRRGVRTASG